MIDFGFRNYRYTGAYYPRVSPAAARTDAWPPNGAPPGADLPFLREQLLDAWGIEYGILNPIVDENCPTQLHSEYGAAIAAAINDWQIAEWLEPEPRLRAYRLRVPIELLMLAGLLVAWIWWRYGRRRAPQGRLR